MIKVEGPHTPNISNIKRKKNSTGQGEFSSFLEEADEGKTLSGVGPVMAPNPFLAIQEVNEKEYQGDEEGKKQGEEMLASLDQLRLALLAGVLPESQIRSLNDMVKKQRREDMDPRLKNVLDEIEVRASVELAKLEKLREEQK